MYYKNRGKPFFWELEGQADILDIWLWIRLLSVPHWLALILKDALSSKSSKHLKSSDDLSRISNELTGFESAMDGGSSAADGTSFETLDWAGLATFLFLA